MQQNKRYRVLPYKQGSRSAKRLSLALGGKVLKLENSTFVSRSGDIIINWGNSGCSFPLALNASVSEVSDKLRFYLRMRDSGAEHLVPPFWTNIEEIPDEAFPVVCRTVLNGHSGAGIVIADNRDELVSCPLYVKYIKKEHEFRVHVGRVLEPALTEGGGYHYEYKTIAVQRKARRLSVPLDEVDWQVRNLAGGFVYTREGFTVPSAVEKAAHDCLRETGLDFGAVDVIWNSHQEKAYVLEVNSAPGLEGQTVEDYAEFFRRKHNEQ